MSGRILPSVREALFATATGARQPMKVLAGELDMSPSELSHKTTLGGDNSKSFPCDDEHLVRLMKVTNDYSVLYTLADLCGFELKVKEERYPELIREAVAAGKEAARKLQLVLELGDRQEKRRGR